MAEQGQIGAGALRGMAQVLSKEMGGAATEAAATFQGAVNRLDTATQGLLTTLGDLITKNPEILRVMNSLADGTRSFTTALQGNLPTLQHWISQVIRFVEKTATLSTLPQDVKNMAQALQPMIAQPPTPELDVTLLGGGTQAGRLGLPGVYEQRLQRYQASFAAIKKLQDEILLRERDLLEAPILGLTPQQVRALSGELDGLKQSLAKLLDPQVLQQRAQATSTAADAAAKYAADTIAGYARDLQAQEAANEERLEEERRVQREMQRIRAETERQMQRDDAEARRQQLASEREAFTRVKQHIDAERQQWEDAQREVTRKQEELQGQVSDSLFGVLRGMTDGALSMKEAWQDALADIQATFLRTLTEMAARALGRRNPHPGGAHQRGGGRDRGECGLQRPAQESVWRQHGTTAPGAADEFGATAGPPMTGVSTTGSVVGAGLGAAGAGLGVGMGANQAFTQAGWTGTGANVDGRGAWLAPWPGDCLAPRPRARGSLRPSRQAPLRAVWCPLSARLSARPSGH